MLEIYTEKKKNPKLYSHRYSAFEKNDYFSKLLQYRLALSFWRNGRLIESPKRVVNFIKKKKPFFI